MVLLSAVLLTLSFAPLGQFYLAWIGLAPLLIVVSRARTVRAAFFWGWLGGTIFFLLNLAYLLLVTIPGALVLPPYLALYWGLAAATIRMMRLIPQAGYLPPETYSILACCVAAVWVAAEWLRGTVFTGLPWLFIGYTQSPLLAICQIADFAGVYGVMFLVVLVNTMAAVTWLHREHRKPIRRGWITTGVLVLASALYGWWRMSQSAPLTPGPTVLVVQPSDRDFRNKAAPEKQRDSVRFHLEQTTSALQRERADLVVWSETTMPALNPEVREELGGAPLGQLSDQTDRAISAIARLNNTSLLVGGFFVDYAAGARGTRKPIGMRNSAFYYDRVGIHAARYDKIHLVPFGEFIPGRESWPRFYRLFLWLSPYADDYTVSTGPADALTVFPLQSRDAASESRFVSPICFDDIDPSLVARMFRGGEAGAGGPPKRADFIVNLTNDGWFRWNEQPQHLQHALFRSIENRAPTARAVNTGVSGFIDSCGRIGKTVPIGQIGTATQQLALDRRVTFYTRFGDVFAYACVAVAAVVVLCGAWSSFVMWASHG
jgi:apolipoprotein N-acyltransferase